MRSAFIVCAAVVIASLTGCGGTGALSMQSAVGPPIVLAGSFNKVIYGYTDANQLDVIMLEGPEDKPTQAVHIAMSWAPRAGRTPIDEFATNATVRYMIFTGEAAGVYSGAGFLFTSDYPGEENFKADLRNTALRLFDRTENFHDRLGLAKVTGGFVAKLDDIATQQSLVRVQKYLREQLGYPAFVKAYGESGIAAK